MVLYWCTEKNDDTQRIHCSSFSGHKHFIHLSILFYLSIYLCTYHCRIAAAILESSIPCCIFRPGTPSDIVPRSRTPQHVASVGEPDGGSGGAVAAERYRERQPQRCLSPRWPATPPDIHVSQRAQDEAGTWSRRAPAGPLLPPRSTSARTPPHRSHALPQLVRAAPYSAIVNQD